MLTKILGLILLPSARRFTAALLCLAPGFFAAAASAERPSIVIILADDLGFSDLGCYGGEVSTPNIDQLARDGLRYTDFYNAARCCPTRASLLTGLYPHQAGIGHMVQDLGQPAYRGELSPNSVTIAQVLRRAGYQTFMVGKWHVTRHAAPEGPRDNWPLQRGFDHFYGTLLAACSYWDPATLMRDNAFIEPAGDYYYTEAISKEAARYIREAEAARPLFLYVAYTAPHWPLHAREEVVAKYRGRFKAGWDVLRQQRLKRLKELGILDHRTELSSRDPLSIPWEAATHKEWEQRRMEVYAAVIDQMDTGVGRIVEALRDTGRLDNALLMFLSDNGASPENHPEGMIPRLGIKWTGQFIPSKTRDGRAVIVGDFPSITPGPGDTYQGYDVKWSNLSNTPFRMHKSWMHEGGIATPLIIHWPSRLKRVNQFRHEPAHVIDIMATLVEVSGAAYPKEFNGVKIHSIEGVSLVPTFTQSRPLNRAALYWEHEGNRAVRRGKWKLVSQYAGLWNYPDADNRWELYDLSTDRTELHDLASVRSQLVRELENLYEDWAKRCGVVPWQQLSDKTK